MNMMTWSETKNTFSNEWLLIIEYQLDGSGHLINGHVERHAKDKTKVYQLPPPGEILPHSDIPENQLFLE